jgi:primosomal protein N' (replication factor Y)
MLAKGHDFPRLTLVGVLGADNALYSGDFRATERLAALLFQVAGRAGRADLAGEVIVQTDFPSHPLARALVAHDYESFAGELLAERRAAMLPPFASLALLTAEAPRREAVDAFLDAASEAGRSVARKARARSKCSRRCRPRCRAERGSSGARCWRVRSTKAQCNDFFRSGAPQSLRCRGRRVRAALDVDPLGFA